jgi:uncharacterized membrane protein
MVDSASSERTPYAWFDPRSTVGRFLFSSALGVTAALATPRSLGSPLKLIAGWDAAALTHLLLVWFGVLSADANVAKERAAEEDPGRRAMWAVVLATSFVGLVAATALMQSSLGASIRDRTLLGVLAFLAVISAWLVTHTSFTLRYAHMFYDERGAEGGLVFPGTQQPDDFDFAYFAFTLGMCFQVSDVAVTNSAIRRWVLAHAVLSFAYNTVIVALTINVLAGFLR